MKSILLKLDNKLFEETERQVKAENTTRVSYIKRALEEYNKMQERRVLEKQLAKEVALLQHTDPDINLKKEHDAASLNDLTSYLD
ncbi:hypothetical protein ACFQ3S_06060 [Mucilaginibacter terrae]|uniref:hypothetical protein n=1 Tax=Mucilaginibacter terrae TaxID=1955052 RepID=UPI003629D4B1